MRGIWQKAILVGLLAALLGLSGALAQAAPAPEKSTAELEAAVRDDPGDLQAKIDLGNRYLEESRYADAQRQFEDAVTIEYRNFGAHFGLGLAHYNQGDLQAALFEFNQLTSMFPDRFEGWFNAGVTLARLRRPQDAITALNQATTVARGRPVSQDSLIAARVYVAEQAKALGRLPDAIRAYEDALQIRPGNTEVRYFLADAVFRFGDADRAVTLLFENLNVDRTDIPSAVLLARALVEVGQPDRAIRELDRSLEAVRDRGGMDNGPLLVQKGLVLRAMAQPAEARQAFISARGSATAGFDANYNLGLAALEDGDYNQALQEFRQADQRSPGSGRVATGIALALDGLGRFDETLQAARQAQQLLEPEEPLYGEASFLAGKSLYALTRYRDAIVELQRATRADPGKALWRQYLGLALYQDNQFFAAAQEFERAAQLLPEDLAIKVNLGAAYYSADRLSDAEQVFNQIIQVAPNTAEARYYLGAIFGKRGRLEDARREFQLAADLGFEPARRALEALQ